VENCRCYTELPPRSRHLSRFPFSPKLRVAALLPAIAGIVAGAALLLALLPPLLTESTAEALVESGRLIAPAVAARLAAGGDPQGWIGDLAQGSTLRITLIAADGHVLADSARSEDELERMENHATRPEIREAMERGTGWATRRSATTGLDYAYAARTVTLPGDKLVLLRLAQPVAKLRTLLLHLQGALLLAAAAAVAAMLVVSWWLSRRLFRPLTALVDDAGRLAAGDLAHRAALPEEQELASLASAVNRLAAQVQAQVGVAESERDHLRAVVSSMSDGVLVTGPDSRALLANPAFARLFAAAAEIRGRAPLEISRQPALDSLVRDTLRQATGRSAEIEIEGPPRRTVALTSAPLASGAGVVVAARDITPFIRLSEMRRDFVANLSHELKTPLAAIRGFAETLRDGALADAAAAPRFVDRILEQSRRLQALLDDLLTLSRLERPGATLERQPASLAELAHHAVDTVATAARDHGVTVAVDTAQAPPFLGDPEGIERLLLNLLDNAIKYNRPGGRVALRVGRQGEEALIEVSDTGIGIPVAALPRIFERFYRVDKGRARDEGGTGLGLAIVKHVAQNHGGRVEVESELGQGSTFRVFLPLGG